MKVTLRFRGREMAHMASSKHVLDDFAELLADVAVVEKAPKVEGRSMTMFLSEKTLGSYCTSPLGKRNGSIVQYKTEPLN